MNPTKDHAGEPALRTRRIGFRKAPADIRAQAEAKLIAHVAEYGSTLAELRPASYCGPGSAGDRGAYMLSLHVAGRGGFALITIEAR